MAFALFLPPLAGVLNGKVYEPDRQLCLFSFLPWCHPDDLEGTMPTDNELFSIPRCKSNIRFSLIIQCDKFITLKVLQDN